MSDLDIHEMRRASAQERADKYGHIERATRDYMSRVGTMTGQEMAYGPEIAVVTREAEFVGIYPVLTKRGSDYKYLVTAQGHLYEVEDGKITPVSLQDLDGVRGDLMQETDATPDCQFNISSLQKVTNETDLVRYREALEKQLIDKFPAVAKRMQGYEDISKDLAGLKK
jgi:hypothetical protein